MKFSQERIHSLSSTVLFFQFYGFETFLVQIYTKKNRKFQFFQSCFLTNLGKFTKNTKITLCDTVTTPGETFVKMWYQINESYLHPFL